MEEISTADELNFVLGSVSLGWYTQVSNTLYEYAYCILNTQHKQNMEF